MNPLNSITIQRCSYAVSRASSNHFRTEYWIEFINEDRNHLLWEHIQFWNVAKYNKLKIWTDVSCVNFSEI